MPLFPPNICGQGFQIDPGTFSLWRFNETVAGDYLNLADSSGGGRTLVAANISLAPKITNGKNGIRYARICDGIEDIMTRAGDAASLAMLQGDWTVELFVRVDSLATIVTQGGMIGYSKGGDLQADNVQMNFAVLPSGKLRVLWESGVGVDTILDQVAGNPLVVGTWSHVAAVKDSVGKTLKFYIDGALQDTLAFANNPDGGTDVAVGWKFGANINNATTLYFNGAMKSVRVSNVALDAATIAADAALLNTTMTLPVIASTFALWQCNEAPDANDECDRGNHLNASAAITFGAPGIIGQPANGGYSKFFAGANSLSAAGHNDDPNTIGLRASVLADSTFECWFRLLDNNAAIRGLFVFGDPAAADIEANNIYGAELQVATPNQIATQWEQGAGVNVNFTPGTIMTASEAFGRHYLAITKTAAAVVQIYLDGVLKFTSGVLTNYTGGTGFPTFLRIGLGFSNTAWAGQMDEVRWSNVIRTPAEIAAAYQAGI